MSELTDATKTKREKKRDKKRGRRHLTHNDINIEATPWRAVWQDVLGGGVVRSVLAILLAMFIGSLLVVFIDEDFQRALPYFFARPSDTFNAAGSVIATAFTSLWQGAVYTYSQGLAPFVRSLNVSAPLIVAGLGVAFGFRAGLFNIGGRGQMLIAAVFCGFAGSSLPLPPVLHLVVTILFGLVGGAIWGGIVGILKARTGAHEVIVTIMLNYVAYYLVTYLLKTPLFQAEGAGGNPISKPIDASAQMPDLIPSTAYLPQALSLSVLLAIGAAVVYWWVMDRSTIGFKVRAVGLNPHAARTAGISVSMITFLTMAISGAFVGLAGTMQVLGPAQTGYTAGVDAGIGFDAITVALLGANNPLGVVLAGLLFGVLKNGSYVMQADGIPPDIILVLQAIIVLFIAAPPLVRGIFQLPVPTGISMLDRLRASRSARSEAKEA